MPAAAARRRGEVTLDVEEDRARDVTGEVGAAAGLGVGEVPAAVDEAIADPEIVTR